MAPPKPIDYRHTGPYDRPVFQEQFTAQFAKSSRYNAAAMPDMLELLTQIEQDTDITDIRWAAYMLATVMWETTTPSTFSHVAVNKKGKPLLNKKGEPIIVTQRKWLMTMAPVDEIGHGKGRKYHEAVKVTLLADGSAREYVRMIDSVGAVAQNETREPYRVKEPIELLVGESMMSIFPHDKLKISCTSADGGGDGGHRGNLHESDAGATFG